ncbi:MAG: squalene/phytoene synthase family protein [Alphaproteobacteria bacterium]|nr:squalene/phytoene synthase family protein [Alphaproteobacteria bacterium]
MSFETASGKGVETENFPVASFLLKKDLRKDILSYYHFAREADDIADHEQLSADEKIRQLDYFAEPFNSDEARHKKEWPIHSIELRKIFCDRHISKNHALDLLVAFKQDAYKLRYENWEELIDYCNHSAAPVGRFLLDLHQESKESYIYADALCNALQIINHLQDCAEDYQHLNRVYLPLSFMKDNKCDVEILSAPQSSSALRQILNLCLERIDQELMPKARLLPFNLKNKGIALQSAIVVEIAEQLINKLKIKDPLKKKVKLSKIAYLKAFLYGIIKYYINK